MATDALKEQNPWILIEYVQRKQLTSNPDFQWTNKYIQNKQVATKLSRLTPHINKAVSTQKFKFGVQIPVNGTHAFNLDRINNNALLREAINKELHSIDAFKTFHILEEGENISQGYVKIPYHFVFDCKFDGRRKARLVAEGHRTPDVAPEEVYSGVVSMETIRIVFVLAAICRDLESHRKKLGLYTNSSCLAVDRTCLEVIFNLRKGNIFF